LAHDLYADEPAVRAGRNQHLHPEEYPQLVSQLEAEQPSWALEMMGLAS
jgi:hypothetical protein